MTTEYEYHGQKFVVSKPDDCTMKVTKDGCTAVISVEEAGGRYKAALEDGTWSSPFGDERTALYRSCHRILEKLNGPPTKKELCDRLVSLYSELDKAKA